MIIQISYNNMKEKIDIPVNPSEIKVGGGGTGFSDVDVIKSGEQTVIGNKKQLTVSFSSFFPKYYDGGYCEYRNIPDPKAAIKKIEAWRSSGQPVKVLITTLNINTYCTIRKFDYSEKGGEPGDIYYDIEFKEFKFITIREVVQNNSSALAKTTQQTSRPNTQTTARYYTVVKGDCLWNIAKKYYGNGAQYTKIFKANSPPIKNANLIYPGQKFLIP